MSLGIVTMLTMLNTSSSPPSTAQKAIAPVGVISFRRSAFSSAGRMLFRYTSIPMPPSISTEPISGSLTAARFMR